MSDADSSDGFDGSVPGGTERTPLLLTAAAASDAATAAAADAAVSASAPHHHHHYRANEHHFLQHRNSHQPSHRQQLESTTSEDPTYPAEHLQYSSYSLRVHSDNVVDLAMSSTAVAASLSASLASSEAGSSRHCHSDDTNRHRLYAAAQLVARRRLMFASGICLVFMLGEVVGGALAGSLAIMTDAAHLLTDLASFLISMLALCLATRRPTRTMSFGWYRAEVMGALVSVLMIWVVTGILVYLAVLRVVQRDFTVDGKIMLITAGAGVAFNLIMALLLHQQSPPPPASESAPAAAAATAINSDASSAVAAVVAPPKLGVGQAATAGELDDNDSDADPVEVELSDTAGIVTTHSARHGHGHGHGHSHSDGHGHSHDHVGFGHHHSHSNMNVRAAFIHVIGDLFQSLGVLVAAFIIYYKPEYKLADPICTFVFSLLVMGTTVSILRDTLRVLMEATPQGLDVAGLQAGLAQLPGVVQVHSLRVWSLTLGRNAASAHLAVHPATGPAAVDRDLLVAEATRLAKSVYHLAEVAFQVEPYVVDMDSCEHCQPV